MRKIAGYGTLVVLAKFALTARKARAIDHQMVVDGDA